MDCSLGEKAFPRPLDVGPAGFSTVKSASRLEPQFRSLLPLNADPMERAKGEKEKYTCPQHRSVGSRTRTAEVNASRSRWCRSLR
jgi:hypothetical protein